MKQLINYALTFFAVLGAMLCSAQNNSTITNLEMGRITPFEMEVTYEKTSHVIFPSGIRYVDLGSDSLAAGKAEDAGNVLRIKAATKGFECETNFSVITEDGKYYCFNVQYSAHPQTLSYDLLKLRKSTEKALSDKVLFDDLGATPPTLAGLIMERIYHKDQRLLRHLASKSYGIRFNLKGLYVQNGQYYFHLELQNATSSPYRIDFINFRAADKKVGRRTVAQDRPLLPLKSYKPQDDVNGGQKDSNVFLLDHFTLSHDKELIIEIFEEYGNRNQLIRVQYDDLLRAKELKEVHLKF